MRRALAVLGALAALAAAGYGLRRWAASTRPRGALIAKFDVHTHLAPDGLERALALFAAHGVARAVNLSGGHKPEQLAVQLEAASRADGRILVFANLNYQHALAPGWVERQVEWLEQAQRMGARGLKIPKALGLGVGDPEGRRVPVDDPRIDPIFEAAGRLGLPVAMHVGDPTAFFDPPTPANERFEELSLNPDWSFADRSVFPTWEALFGEFERRVARHPRTTFIGVHFGNDPEDPPRVAAMLDRYPNYLVDTSARVGEIGRQPADRLRTLFVAHRRRILFGTDLGVGGDHLMLGAPGERPEDERDAVRFYEAHWRFFETPDRGMAHPTPIQGRWTVDGIDLPEDVLHDLYHANAERLFGISPAGPAKRSP